MTISLTLADNGDGTGAVATIAGSAVGSANTVYVADLVGGLSASGWSVGGTRTADGTVPLSQAVGKHWAYLLNVAAGVNTVTPVQGYGTTSAQQSVFEKCLNACYTIVAGVSLSGFNPANINIQKLPWDRSLAHPGIVVCPTPESIDSAGQLIVTNRGTVIGYGVSVACIQSANQDQSSNLSRWLRWREQLRRAFEDSPTRQPLQGLVAEVSMVMIEPGAIYDPASFSANYDIQGFTVRCLTREQRAIA